MARFVCVLIPNFAAQTLVRLRPELRDQAVAVLEGDRPLEHVCSLNQAALHLGVEAGISRAEAEVFPVQLLHRSSKEELSAKSALLSCLAIFCPAIEEFPSPAECLYVLDLDGTNRLHGSVAAAMRRIRTHILDLGFMPRLTSSANLHAALCLARSGHTALAHTPAGTEAAVLSPLPLRVLDLNEDHATTLKQWGIKTLGDLARLPEVELISRLGQQGQRLHQLACGKAPHHFQSLQTTFALEEFVEFDSPVETQESLLFVLNSMLTQLVSRATAHALALASITVLCTLEAAPPHRRTLQPALPSIDRAVFLKLLQLDLEAHPPAAGVLALRLSADPGRTSKVQLGLFSPQLPEPMLLEVTLARLAAIVGEDRVGQAALSDTHQHDTFLMRKFTLAPPSPFPSTCLPHSPALRRLRPCAAIRVELQGEAIFAFWHEQTRYEVQRLYGPWHFSGEWWSGMCWAVERWDFAALSADSLLLGVILRNHVDRSWWLEAIYD